jgi:hypothetical protein
LGYIYMYYDRVRNRYYEMKDGERYYAAKQYEERPEPKQGILNI